MGQRRIQEGRGKHEKEPVIHINRSGLFFFHHFSYPSRKSQYSTRKSGQDRGFGQSEHISQSPVSVHQK
jgi:hypothetical protein